MKRMIVIAVSAAALLLAALSLPGCLGHQRTLRYDNPVAFEKDLAGGKIASVTLYADGTCVGDLRPGSNLAKTKYAVVLPREPQYHGRLRSLDRSIPVTYRSATPAQAALRAALNIVPFAAFRFYIVPLTVVLLALLIARGQRRPSESCANSD